MPAPVTTTNNYNLLWWFTSVDCSIAEVLKQQCNWIAVVQPMSPSKTLGIWGNGCTCLVLPGAQYLKKILYFYFSGDPRNIIIYYYISYFKNPSLFGDQIKVTNVIGHDLLPLYCHYIKDRNKNNSWDLIFVELFFVLFTSRVVITSDHLH